MNYGKLTAGTTKTAIDTAKPFEKGEIITYLSRMGDVLHHIFQNDQHLVVLAEGVNAIIQSDETAAEGREHKICVLARFDVISTEAAEILAEDKIDLVIRSVLHQPVQSRTVEGRTRNAVITVIIVQRPTLFPHIAGEHFLLIFYGHGFPGTLIVPAQPCVNTNDIVFLHFLI